MHVPHFGNKLNEEVCCGFIFVNLFHSLYLLVGLWWNMLVTNLATNFQDLVVKVKNLVALVPVLAAISSTPWVPINNIDIKSLSHHVISISRSCKFFQGWKPLFVIKGQLTVQGDLVPTIFLLSFSTAFTWSFPGENAFCKIVYT